MIQNNGEIKLKMMKDYKPKKRTILTQTIVEDKTLYTIISYISFAYKNH